MVDVRRVLGDPDVAHDVSGFTKPYPGDYIAKAPVWTYHDGDWDILVYFARYCFSDVGTIRETDYDLLCAIHLLPKKPVHFDLGRLPSTFSQVHTDAPCAAWDEYSDGAGLVYEVFTVRSKYGGEVPGNLNRIVYGPSNAEIAAFKARLAR